MREMLSHVAVTVARELFQVPQRTELLAFYSDVFGWEENESRSLPGERIFLRAPTDRQYLTIRASDSPMQTSGYEHLGFYVDSVDELRRLHARARQYADRDDRVELSELKVAYDERLHSFRVRYLLPLSLEVQYLSN